jgi:glycosyltransferase involved in cell wall biosynthesis
VLADGSEGLLVAPGDVGALAGAVGELVGDPGRARALGRAAKERVAELGPDTIAKRLDVVYQEIIGRG